MELKLAAAIAKDEKMSQAFKDGQDLHSVTAESIGCTRQIAKSANFGLLYGSGPNGLRNYAAGMGVSMTLEELQKLDLIGLKLLMVLLLGIKTCLKKLKTVLA